MSHRTRFSFTLSFGLSERFRAAKPERKIAAAPTPAVTTVLTIPAQPRPVDTNITRSRNAAGHFTAIAREWRDMADVARCGLCPLGDCQARRTGRPHCLVGVAAFVKTEDTRLFSRVAWDGAQTAMIGGAR